MRLAPPARECLVAHELDANAIGTVAESTAVFSFCGGYAQSETTCDYCKQKTQSLFLSLTKSLFLNQKTQ